VTAYLALLRGINVGPTTQLAMAELRQLVQRLGHGNVRTHLRTGNVMFTVPGDRADPPGPAELAAQLQRHIAEDLGVPAKVLIRSAAELAAVVSGNPLSTGGHDPARLHVTFLDAAPARTRIAELDGLPAEGEEFAVAGREVYLYCPHGYGRTKLSNTNLEKRLGVVATTRSWKVTTTLHAMITGGSA
jgi:uncharacterized protein (DUF1697 family)